VFLCYRQVAQGKNIWGWVNAEHGERVMSSGEKECAISRLVVFGKFTREMAENIMPYIDKLIDTSLFDLEESVDIVERLSLNGVSYDNIVDKINIISSEQNIN
jgi:hypothetical protein